jgi:hypothetical protein
LSFTAQESRLSGFPRLAGLFSYSKKGKQDSPHSNPFGPPEDTVSEWQMPCGVICAFIAIFAMGRWGDRTWVELTTFLLILIAGFLILTGSAEGASENKGDSNRIFPRSYSFQHDPKIVQQKLLTSSNYRYTVITSRDGHGERS